MTRALLPGMRVALADDDQDLGGLLTTFLEREGFVVLEAHDGAELVEVVRHGHPDAVVTDIHMPHLGGLEAFRAIRRELAHLPVVLMTSLPDEAVCRAVATGTQVALLVKPFAPRRLVELLRELVGRASRPSWAA